MNKILILIFSLALSYNVVASTPSERSKVKKEIERYIETLKTDSVFYHTNWSAMIKKTKTGEVIAQKDPQLYLAGASITKLITTGVALNILGGDFKYTTRLEYSGEVQDSTLKGTLYIVGGADPTLGSDYDEFSYITDSMFYHWKKALKAAGIAHIEGKVVGDARYFADEVNDSWTWDDFDTDYGTSVSGLSFFENKMIFYLSPASKIGEAPRVDSTYPYVPSLKVINRASTVEGNKNTLWFNASPLHPDEHFLTGTLGKNRKDATREFTSNRMAPYSLLYAFVKYMEQGTVDNNVEYSVWNAYSTDIDTTSERHLIYTHYSPSLKEIASVTNKYSDNMYAETILRTVGKIKGKGDSTVEALKIEKEYLENIASGASSLRLNGGSGLSRTTFLNADYYTKYLCQLTFTDAFDDFYASLAIPGGNGTFKNALKDCPTKQNLHVKSGTLNSVRAYAGYAGSGDDMICFIIMVNRYHSVKEINERLAPLLELMSKY
ncbi:MAG: D-alanyl-D-alanine carboxypeptidase/D-alanyl-D-alanine-endopeptidase [Flavobacteriales bacterium]|nr:D-alanyl-D-alanine carboxypeptidase/D-alanyl-D-alanine-endopeptidase [Flavobacteriales bacterium]